MDTLLAHLLSSSHIVHDIFSLHYCTQKNHMGHFASFLHANMNLGGLRSEPLTLGKYTCTYTMYRLHVHIGIST